MSVLRSNGGRPRSFSASRTREPRCRPTFGPGSTKPAACSPTRTGTSTSSMMGCCRGHDGPRDLPPLRHRRQSRSHGRQPLSRPEHHRPHSRNRFRRQADLAGWRGARRRRTSKRGWSGSTPLPRRAGRGDRAGAARSWRRDSLRLPLDPHRISRFCSRASCRISTSAPTTGKSCAPEIDAAVGAICRAASGYDAVVNGRFKGGWTTRHYGRPEAASTPSRWNWRSRRISPPRRRPSPMTPTKADRLRRPPRRHSRNHRRADRAELRSTP